MNRPAFLRTTASGLFAAPAVISRVLQESAVPAMPSGVQVGDVTPTRAIIWSAADRRARLLVEVARDERFTSSRLIEGPVALEDSQFTAKLDLGGLAAGKRPLSRRGQYRSHSREQGAGSKAPGQSVTLQSARVAGVRCPRSGG